VPGLKIPRGFLRTLAGVTAGTLLLAPTLGASATADPLPPAPFTYCPMHYQAPGEPPPQPGHGLRFCFASIGTGGTFKMGKVTVALTPGTVLQGGFWSSPDFRNSFVLADPPSKTLDSPGQQVPGGLLGVALIQNLIPGITSVTAQVVLAGPASSNFRNLIYAETPGITLPVVVKLINPLLGPDCSIGTPAHPMILNLTNGTTNPPPPALPISGDRGSGTTMGIGSLYIGGLTVVDNTWGAPGATGCGALGLLNEAVNLQSGLPSAAGNNEARLSSNVYLVDPHYVFADAPYPGF
jgi:hypothetical protein